MTLHPAPPLPAPPRARIVLYAMLTSLTAISLDALLPGLRLIGADLAPAPPLTTQHIVSLFVFGMVAGELLIGPMSDALGRKSALVAGLVIYALGTLTALFASSLETVVLGRVLQGIGVAGPKIATRAMIRDQFEGAAMARVMSLMFTIFIFVPMLAPALGQGVIAVAGWRGVFALYLALALVLGVWLVARHPETLPPEARIPFRPRLYAANVARVLSSRRVVLLILATGLVFGAQLLYLATAADLFFDVYRIDAGFPLVFAILAAAIGLASFVNARLVERHGTDAMLFQAYAGLCVASAVLLGAALLTGGRPPFWLFLATGFAAFFAIGILFGNLNAVAMTSLGAVAGIGASLIASGSSLVAFIFAVAFGALYDGTALTLPAAFLAAGAGAFALTVAALRADPRPIEATR